MNPLKPIMKLLKAIAYLLLLPFMVIGMVFQGVWMLFTGLLSVTAYLLAFGCILAAFGALLGLPFLFLARSHDRPVDHFEHVDRMVHVHSDGLGSKVVTHHTFGPDWRRGKRAQTEIVYVGPRGRQLKIARVPGVEPPAPPAVMAEIDENDVDFSELGVSVTADCEPDCEPEDAPQDTGVVPSSMTPLQSDTGLLAETEAPSSERPDWVDAILSSEDTLSLVRVEAGPCISRAAACDVAYRDAQDQAIVDFVRDRSDVCLADLGVTAMPWHQLTVRRIAHNLRLRPTAEFSDTHDVSLAGEAQRTYFKYGMLEFSPGVRDHIDREITRWARSFLAGGMWGMLLAGIGGIYLALQLQWWQKIAGLFSTRPRRATLAVAMVLGGAVAALTALVDVIL